MRLLTLVLKTLLFSAIMFISGCSENDDSEGREEFLTALIDGQEFSINKSNGSIKCEKQLTEFGTINLSVKVLSAEGKSIEFLIRNYLGKQLYSIGERTNSVEGNFTNGHYLNYSQPVPQEFWSSVFDNYSDSELQNYIEITEDNGSFISGKFSSENYQAPALCLR